MSLVFTHIYPHKNRAPDIVQTGFKPKIYSSCVFFPIVSDRSRLKVKDDGRRRGKSKIIRTSWPFCSTMSFWSLVFPSPPSLSAKPNPLNGYGKIDRFLVRSSSDVPDFLSADWYNFSSFPFFDLSLTQTSLVFHSFWVSTFLLLSGLESFSFYQLVSRILVPNS